MIEVSKIVKGMDEIVIVSFPKVQSDVTKRQPGTRHNEDTSTKGNQKAFGLQRVTTWKSTRINITTNKNIFSKNAFQQDAYRPLQWLPYRGGLPGGVCHRSMCLPRGCLPRRVFMPRGCLPKGACLPGGYNPMDKILDTHTLTCENIAFL